jgi:hypothetical protein
MSTKLVDVFVSGPGHLSGLQLLANLVSAYDNLVHALETESRTRTWGHGHDPPSTLDFNMGRLFDVTYKELKMWNAVLPEDWDLTELMRCRMMPREDEEPATLPPNKLADIVDDLSWSRRHTNTTTSSDAVAVILRYDYLIDALQKVGKTRMPIAIREILDELHAKLESGKIQLSRSLPASGPRHLDVTA